MSNREDLIKDLYKNVIGESPDTNSGVASRYSADTNTLTNGQKIQFEESARRHEIPLESHDYNEVSMGNRNYYLVKDDNYLINDVIAFREVNGFQSTGNASLRTINFVEKNVPGLVPGYCIVSFK